MVCMNGIDELRRAAGSGSLSVDQLADQMIDFVQRHPDATPVVDDLAAFLAGVDRDALGGGHKAGEPAS